MAEFQEPPPFQAASRGAPGPEPQDAGADAEPEAPRIADLVRACLAGDLGAFEEIVERYKRAVYNVAYYKSRNAFDAEDLTQDIFLAAYHALPSLKDPELFSGWLMGIAHNRCHKWFRRERTKVLKFKELHRRREQDSRLAWREEASAGSAEPDLLSREIQNLPHEIRRVLVLKYLEGRSYEEIEAEMGLKAFRIDYLIRKGKSLLRKRLRLADSAGAD